MLSDQIRFMFGSKMNIYNDQAKSSHFGYPESRNLVFLVLLMILLYLDFVTSKVYFGLVK